MPSCWLLVSVQIVTSNKVLESPSVESTGILCCSYLGYFSIYKGIKERVGNKIEGNNSKL